MLKATLIKGSGKTRSGAQDMIAYLKATEYYKDKDGQSRDASHYQGMGSEAFGLKGVVSHEVMDRLARGFDPEGNPLCQNAGDPDRRMGYDLTFSAPKSVSCLFADPNVSASIKDGIIEAQRRAVGAAFGYIEKNAKTRRGAQGREVIGVNGLIGMEFNHFSGRNQYDSQIHSHLFVPNLALGEDGQWGTFDNSVLMELQMAGGAIYRATLAQEMEKLGFAIEKDVRYDKHGKEVNIFFRIAGVHPDFEKMMSSRRQEIEAYMAENGVSADTACLATRKHKDEPTWEELQLRWKEIYDVARMNNPEKFLTEKELLNQTGNVGAATDAEILKKLHLTNSVFTRAQLIEEIAKENVGVMGLAQIEAECESFLERNHVFRLKDNQRGKEQFAAAWMVKMEKGIIERAEARQGDLSVRLSKAQVEAAIQKFEKQKNVNLTLEQRAAVEHVCLESGGTACLTGFAGTGKTFSSLAFIEAYKSAGYEVIGTAISGQAAKKLQYETDVKSYSCASLIHRLGKGKMQLTKQTIIVLDEAGMSGSPTISALQKHCDAVGAKLILMGDIFQLQPIEAGAAFKLAIDQVGDAKLSGIQRQEKLEDRVTASAFYGIKEELVKDIHKRTVDRNAEKIMGSIHQKQDTFTEADLHQAVKDLNLRGVNVDDFFHDSYWREVPTPDGKIVFQAKWFDGDKREESLAKGQAILEQKQMKLETLERQRMVQACANPEINGELIYKRMQARNQIVECDTDKQARNSLVKDYFASTQPVEEKLVLAATRDGVHKLNEAIRDELKIKGELTNPTKINMINDAGDPEVKEFCIGDRLRFTQKLDDLGVINGTHGIIERIEAMPDSKGHAGYEFQVRVQSEIKEDDGVILKFNANDFSEFNHNYAMTVHASQGQGKNEVFSLCNAGMTDRHLALVGFTRSKQDFKLYGTSEDFENIQDRFQMDRLKVTSIEESKGFQSKAVKLAAQQKAANKVKAPEVAPEKTKTPEKVPAVQKPIVRDPEITPGRVRGGRG